jgi:hypothetical protein
MRQEKRKIEDLPEKAVVDFLQEVCLANVLKHTGV